MYYAFAIVGGTSTETFRGATSNGSGDFVSSNGISSGNPFPVSVCVNSGVQNPGNATDANADNFVTFSSLATVNCPARLNVKLNTPIAVGPTGFRAGFVVGGAGLANLNVLEGLRIVTYLNTQRQDSATGLSIIRANVLSSDRSIISFLSNKPFNRVELKQTQVLAVLSNLEIYYGFGIEDRAFRDDNPVYSDHADPTDKFQTSTVVPSGGLLNVNVCAVVGGTGSNICTGFNNPHHAVDQDLLGKAAVIDRTLLTGNVNNGLALNLKLNGAGKVPNGTAGKAGNRAGVVLSYSGGLLNGLLSAGLLSNFVITTYREVGVGREGSTGNKAAAIPTLVPVESATGLSLAQVTLLGGNTGPLALSFIATQDFDWVEVTINNVAQITQATNVFHAFAERVRTGIPTNLITPLSPLPVELTAFSAKAAGAAVNVAWRTASERNNSHFVVERSTDPQAGFRAIGQVAGSGTSATGRSYSFYDEEAQAQGATVLYYRLRQVDTDGTESFSPVAVVNWQAAALTMEVFPNPTDGTTPVTLRLSATTDAGQHLLVYNSVGVLVLNLPAAGNVLELPTKSLRAGVYHVVLQTPAGRKLASQRLVVQSR